MDVMEQIIRVSSKTEDEVKKSFKTGKANTLRVLKTLLFEEMKEDEQNAKSEKKVQSQVKNKITEKISVPQK